MTDLPKVDIIIPCYHSHATIDRAIGSIISQRVVEDITVTLVNDGGDDDYSEIIHRYQPLVDIQELRYEENRGPGYARNFGIDNTTKPLIMFMDSDDALANPFSVLMMRNEMLEDVANVMCICGFLEEVAYMKIKMHEKDTSFMHGKMYSRDFLNKYHIRCIDDGTYNEDVGFNIYALLVRDQQTEHIKWSDFVSYYWLCNPNSIVRSNQEKFNNHTSFLSFGENFIYLFKKLEQIGKRSTQIEAEKCTAMLRLWLRWRYLSSWHPEYRESNWEIVEKFYREIYRKSEKFVSDQLIVDAYNAVEEPKVPATDFNDIKIFLKELHNKYGDYVEE